MGVVNVTPDSFGDMGTVPASQDGNTRPTRLERAIERGLDLAEQGADLIDVGGESARPGAERVGEAEELSRVLPVVAALAGTGLAVSVDTTRAAVARAAIAAGAVLVNDVSGGLADAAMYATVAASAAGYVLQHWRVPYDHRSTHRDVVAEVRQELVDRIAAALAAGLPPSRLVIDPGLGFGKTPAQSWALIAQADAIADLGYPVLWGTSRKRFLAEVYPGPTEPWQRDQAGAAVTALLAHQRVWAIRVHDISVHRTAVAVAEAVRAARSGPGWDAGTVPSSQGTAPAFRAVPSGAEA